MVWADPFAHARPMAAGPAGRPRLTTWDDLLRQLAQDQEWPALYPEGTDGGFHSLSVANKVRPFPTHRPILVAVIATNRAPCVVALGTGW